jgi:hypothetical protein
MARKVYMARWESSHSPRPFVSHQQAQDPVPGKSLISETPFRETKTVSPPSLVQCRNQSPPNSNTCRRVNQSNTQRSRPRRKS